MRFYVYICGAALQCARDDAGEIERKRKEDREGGRQVRGTERRERDDISILEWKRETEKEKEREMRQRENASD